MTVKEAQEHLETAPCSETKKSRMNPSFSQAQMHKIIQDCIDEYAIKNGPNYVIPTIIEKRVHQIAKNQRRPRY